MAMLTTHDSFYRYKIPTINIKIEGKGNGVKTVVVNLEEIAKAVGRPANYILKYFAYELCLQTKIETLHNESRVQTHIENKRYIINGEQTVDKLHTLMRQFVNRFVVCEKCNNPETTPTTGKGGGICQTCKACGHTYNLRQHKLIPFILKSLPKKETTKDKLDVFYKFLLSQTDFDTKIIIDKAAHLNLKNKAILIICHVVFDNHPELVQHLIKQHRNLFLSFTTQNVKAQRYFLGGLEQVFLTNKNVLYVKIPQILQTLYDDDIVDEHVFLRWGQTNSNRFVAGKHNMDIRQMAFPFLKWLREAEEELTGCEKPFF